MTAPAAQTRAGGCQCGGVRYRLTGAPLALYVCHCLECRKQSASAFGMSLDARRADLVLTAGTPRVWSRPTASGGRLDCAFCPDCGSRLWHQGSGTDATVTIKAGSLDEAVDASEAIHIWVTRKLPGIVIPPGAARFDEEPPATATSAAPGR
jgi:hypothetical protein